MHTRTGFLVVLLAVAGCGRAGMSVSEYAAAAETLVVQMEGDFERIESHWTASPPTVEGAIEYWEHRLGIRHEFLEGIEDLAPPEGLAPMHESAVDIFTRLNAADEAVAASVRGYTSISDHWQWDQTPEGQAVLAIMAEVYDLCRAAQADFDATARGSELPWAPSDLTRRVSVAFGCPPPPSG